MGSQTLIILRQGIWASLTGGFYFDPNQGVFCNVVHLYLWLFLLTCPFFAYLYFPGTWKWCIYCILTSVTILGVKLINMALHRLYDRAQSMSDSNLKHQFLKITKETEVREDETGIEMKVMGNNGSRDSVGNAIHEASDENSMMSMENVNSIIDLKVDVHRKNSSESIELMFYPPSRGSQQDQHSIAGSASVSKSIRSNNTATGGSSGCGVVNIGASGGISEKYLTVYPEHETSKDNLHISQASNLASIVVSTPTTTQVTNRSCQPLLLRKSSEEFKRRHQQRRRLERQRSLDTAPDAGETVGNKLMRNPSDTLATRNETFLHSQAFYHNNNNYNSNNNNSNAAATLSKVTAASTITSTPIITTTASNPSSSNAQRLAKNPDILSILESVAPNVTTATSTATTTINSGRNARLQRHRSSETHDERLKQQNRSIYLPIHHEQHHHHNHHHHHQRHGSSGASSIGALVGSMMDTNDLDLGLGGSSSGVAGVHINDGCAGALQSWILGSSSDIYMEDDIYTKSDFGIEQFDDRSGNSGQSGRATFLMMQQQQQQQHNQHNLQQQQQQQPQRFRHQRQGCIKRRRHSNANTNFRGGSVGPNCGNNDDVESALENSIFGTTTSASVGSGIQASVRRIKSAALEISCPRPSISNLSPHPNSVEAINGQQQIRNPSSALLPPPSKCLVRNPHLNLCPKFGGSFGGSSGGSGNNLTFGVNTSSDSTLALIEPVHPIMVKTEKSTEKRKSLKRSRKATTADSERHKNDDNENVNIDILSIIETTMRTRDGHADEDDDDAVDDVPVQRRRKALGCRQNRRSVESDVGEILADGDNEDDDDDDEVDEVDQDVFKDFDDNLEHILQDLQQTHNQLDELKAVYEQEAKLRSDFDDEERQHQSKVKKRKSKQTTDVDDEDFDGDDATNNDLEAIEAMRERSHSTDSETDNKGSRSPLLSNNKKWETENSAAKAADKALQTEIAALQQKHKQTPPSRRQQQQVPLQLQELQKRAEGDSGCPSSDCEQISASSKDMLLAGLDVGSEEGDGDKLRRSENFKKSHQSSSSKDIEEGGGDLERKLSETSGKNLGAIPKIVKYREVNEMSTNDGPSTSAAAAAAAAASLSSTTHLHHKRVKHIPCQCPPEKFNNNNNDNNSNTARIATSRDDRSLKSVTSTKAISRTSSSTSSCSLNAYSLSADMQKMFYFMAGGNLDERVRSMAGIANENLNTSAISTAAGGAANSSNVQTNILNPANFKFYKDALEKLSSSSSAAVAAAAAASCHPSSSVDLLSLSEHRAYVREKMRRSSKQISEPSYNASLAEFSQHALEFPSAQLSSTLLSNGNAITTGGGGGGGGGSSSGRASLQHHAPFGVVVASSALNSRNVSNAATLSMQGFFDAINEERNVATQTEQNASHGNILHRDYCDYWRPCMLSAEKPIIPKSFYKYRINFCGFERDFKISMDRLELLALFDRDLHWLHIILSVALCACVAYLGSTILQHGYYKDLFAFVFCAVIAGAQYSLVKSVQPDAASPIHGFNKTVAYSRAIYFSLCGGLLLLFEHLKHKYAETPPAEFIFFGVQYSPVELNLLLLQIMYILLLCFPLIFSLGLFPQINTFLMYLLEQVDMHVFGGNAAGSLLGSFCCVLRSLIGISLLYGPLYAALADGRGTQYIVFSIFCAMLIPIGYHLSRSASDFSHLWALIKTCIVSTYRDDDDELSGSASAVSIHKSNSKRRSVRSIEHDLPPTEGSNEQIEMSSMEKLAPRSGGGGVGGNSNNETTTHRRRRSKSKASSLGSSSQTLGKPMSSSKKAINGSNSYVSMDGVAIAIGNSGVGNAESSERELNILSKNSNIINENSMLTPFEHDEKPEIDCNMDDDDADNDDEDDDDDDDDNNENDDDNDKISNSSTTHPGDMSTLTAGGVGDVDGVYENGAKLDGEAPDPLPKKLQMTVNTRLKNDLVVMTFLAVIVLGLHSSTVFTVLQPDLNIVLYAFTGTLGLILHYIIPQMRKHMPWLCFSRPILRQKEFGQFEVQNAPKVMWFEKVYIYLCMLERNVLFPLLIVSALTADAQNIATKYGIPVGTLIVAVCSLKFIRNAYSDPTNQYLIVIFTVLLFRIDFAVASETFLIDYFFVSLAYRKCCDFLLKLQFIVTYIAPWQITWGSAFHAFAQPFSVPHSAMLFLQAGVSAILSTPLNPFLGSAIFLTSYVRPIKFWERDYNTRRIDHSNTRLVSQLERDLGADDNNLNSIFYEHLTRSLQHSLCGDLLMGRWGNVNQGDCFVLASDYLNCLVHIIELGNGLCTFQMRGLEFRGTYCQQREVEAITEDVEDNDGFCCCDPGHLPRMLSANAMFSTRWLAWQVVAAQYVLEGYSISDNLASATLQVFEYRKVLITYYIKSIIYYVLKNPKLEQWLASTSIQEALQHTLSRQFVDLDPIFNHNLDEDFDFRAMGVTRSSFCYIYLSWINFCSDKRKENQNLTAATPQHANGTSPSNTNVNANNNNNNNDSKSTPNLSTPTLTTAGVGGSSNSNPTAKSQSQQQLRTRPQKSATMSSSATVNNNAGEPMASSQSYANIMRQTSESAPGLSGVGFSYALTASPQATSTAVTTQQNLQESNSLHNSTTAVGIIGGGGGGGAVGNNPSLICTPISFVRSSTMKTPTSTDDNKLPHRTADTSPLPLPLNSKGEVEFREKPVIKLKVPTVAKDSPIVSLCLALSLLARRSLATASHGSLTGVEFFLHGLHALFKGDFRITSPRDEWVFADMELLHAVVAPSVKMALKLQQDHISNPDEFLDPQALFEAIDTCAKDLVISHEADPVWRSAVLRGAPNLLALRHVMEDGSDEYRIIRLAKRFLSFRVIKLNRECVRGLWAGQQQELIYLRNRNPERGSIQNAKQALRNIINSSCDQPIGYPIYVSPLTTSYADTNQQLCDLIGGAITLESIKSTVFDWWHHIRERCRQGCSSGSAMGAGAESTEIAPVYISAPLYNTLIVSNCMPTRTPPGGVGASLSTQYGSDGLAGTIRGGGLAVLPLKPTSTTLFATFLNRDQENLRELRGLRKSQTQERHSGVTLNSQRGERERRATLPIASTSLGVVGTAIASSSSNEAAENDDSHLEMTIGDVCGGGGGGVGVAGGYSATGNASPRYAKISASSGSLGIGNIITTPGDYPRKTKGPICLTSVSAMTSDGASKMHETRKPRIELYKKVIIVDGTEIYDCLDLGRKIDVTWPSEEMRLRGGHMSWRDWIPRVGMVGHVVHYWNMESDHYPNHNDQRFRSHINRIVYLVEIGDHFVPVGEYGLREYNQIMGGDDVNATTSSSTMTTMNARHSSMHHYHHELDELRREQIHHQQQQQQHQQREHLTTISSSDFESPTLKNYNENVKIQAVSSSSSEDDDDDINGVVGGDDNVLGHHNNSNSSFNMHKREILNVWKMMVWDKQQQNVMQEQQEEGEQMEENTLEENKTIDEKNQENKVDGEKEEIKIIELAKKVNLENINEHGKNVEEKNVEEEKQVENSKKITKLDSPKEIFTSAESQEFNEEESNLNNIDNENSRIDIEKTNEKTANLALKTEKVSSNKASPPASIESSNENIALENSETENPVLTTETENIIEENQDNSDSMKSISINEITNETEQIENKDNVESTNTDEQTSEV